MYTLNHKQAISVLERASRDIYTDYRDLEFSDKQARKLIKRDRLAIQASKQAVKETSLDA